VAGNKVFTSDNFQSFTVVGAAGVAAADIATGISLQAAPTYIGGADPLAGATVGNQSTTFPFDLTTLFDDANIPFGDSLTISVDGAVVADGILDISYNEVVHSGFFRGFEGYSFLVTATDESGASVSQTVAFDASWTHAWEGIELSFDRNFGTQGDDFMDVSAVRFFNSFDPNGGRFYSNSGSDTLVFGDSAFEFSASQFRFEVFDFGYLYRQPVPEQAIDDGDTVLIGDLTLSGGPRFAFSFTDDTIEYGSDASVPGVYMGDGNDTVTIGDNSVSSLIVAGFGADTITFGDNAQNVTLYLNDEIDLDHVVFQPDPTDGDADQIIFDGKVLNASITGFEVGIDTIAFTNATGLWTAQNVGGNMAFTSNDGQSFTVVGAGTSAAADITTGLTYNSAPTFVGASTALANGVTGSENAATYAQDLSALFSDANGVADTVTITTSALPSGFALSNSVLSISDPSTYFAAGDHTVTVTATDTSSTSISQDITLSVAMDHNFGASFGASTGTVTFVNASDLSDAAIFGDFAAANAASAVTYNGKAGDDAVIFGANAAEFGGAVTVNAGTGADTVSFGSNAGIFGGTINVDLGPDADADTLIFIGSVENTTVTAWTITLDDGTNTALSDGTSDLTFIGITGVTDVSDFLI